MLAQEPPFISFIVLTYHQIYVIWLKEVRGVSYSMHTYIHIAVLVKLVCGKVCCTYYWWLGYTSNFHSFLSHSLVCGKVCCTYYWWLGYTSNFHSFLSHSLVCGKVCCTYYWWLGYTSNFHSFLSHALKFTIFKKCARSN